ALALPARSAGSYQPKGKGNVTAGIDLQFAHVERIRRSMPVEELIPGAPVPFYSSQLQRRRHVKHHDVGVVIRKNAFIVVFADGFSPAFYQGSDLAFIIGILSGLVGHDMILS